jgi:hypothetical protein
MIQRTLPVLVLLAFALAACGDSAADDGHIYTTADEVGDGDGDPGPDPCPAAVCTEDIDCCSASLTLASGTFAELVCGPSANYPNRWDCQSGECVNLGCDLTHPCPDPWECHTINAVNLCITPCDPMDPDSCDLLQGNHPGMMSCTGETDATPAEYFCEQS